MVRLPGGGVRVRRSALTAWLRRLEEQDTQDGQEQGADGQLRRQVLGHQEARQRHRGTVPGPVGRRRPRALQVVQGPPLADGFLDDLKDAVRDRRPFSPRTGLPDAETTGGEMVTWYAHARAYAEAKWASLAPVSRRSVAEALVTVTIALTAKEPGAPEAKVLRQALFAWAFNPATRDSDPPREIAVALGWAERASLPVAELDDTATVRLALAACARTLAGKAAAGSTQRRKRSVFYNALGYAVEHGPPRLQPGRPHPVDHPRRRRERRPAGRGQPRPGQEPAGRRPGAERPGAAPGGVLRLPVLRRAAPVGGGHAPRGRPVPAEEGMGEDRPGRLRLPGGHGLDRPRHRPPGTRPEAPRRQRDPHHPHPARTRPAAARPHQEVRHHPGRADLPDRPGRHPPGLRLQRGLGPRPASRPSPRPSTGRRSAAARTTCGTRRCRCG